MSRGDRVQLTHVGQQFLSIGSRYGTVVQQAGSIVEVVRDGETWAHWSPIAFWEPIPPSSGDAPAGNSPT